ncbi:hypothetical protein GCM10007893_17420 [Paracoccus marinus]|nr:hypothetical protein GCM10007893_17420 [Paracoccus marinus]
MAGLIRQQVAFGIVEAAERAGQQVVGRVIHGANMNERETWRKHRPCNLARGFLDVIPGGLLLFSCAANFSTGL